MKLRPYYPAFLWALVILVLTLTPGKFIPKMDYWSVFSIDKYVHFSIFFLQVWLLLMGARKQYGSLRLGMYCVFLIVGIAFGMTIEFIQTMIPARSFELNDMIANTAGAAGGAVLFYFIKNKN